jgi:hypothetical protein
VGEVLSISEEPASLAALEESLGKYNTTLPCTGTAFFVQILIILILRLLGAVQLIFLSLELRKKTTLKVGFPFP